MAGTFQLNIDPSEYQAQIDQLNTRINNLRNLASQYAGMKQQAENAWGTEDANLAKAQEVCDTAVRVIEQKIEGATQSMQAIQQILEAGDTLSAQSSSGLEAANAEIQSLLK